MASSRRSLAMTEGRSAAVVSRRVENAFPAKPRHILNRLTALMASHEPPQCLNDDRIDRSEARRGHGLSEKMVIDVDVDAHGSTNVGSATSGTEQAIVRPRQLMCN